MHVGAVTEQNSVAVNNSSGPPDGKVPQRRFSGMPAKQEVAK